MKFKIVSDSSSNQRTLGGAPFASVPMHIIVDDADFSDEEGVDLQGMEAALASCKKSGTACPGVGDWLDAFGDAEYIFCVTVTSALSGSYHSAMVAKQDYEEHHPGRRVYLIDSLSAGPELTLLLEKLAELTGREEDPEAVYRQIQAYARRTHLLFALESLTNLSKNGRVSPTMARLAGILGIRVVGIASDAGQLELVSKCRGEQRALSAVVSQMKAQGFGGGKVRIAHNANAEAASRLSERILADFPKADVQIMPTTALCSYYAEVGGLMIGYES